MEIITDHERSLRERITGETILHTASTPENPSPVTPDQLIHTLDETTIRFFGKEVGRAAFRACFPDSEELYNARYGLPVEATLESA